MCILHYSKYKHLTSEIERLKVQWFCFLFFSSKDENGKAGEKGDLTAIRWK